MSATSIAAGVSLGGVSWSCGSSTAWSRRCAAAFACTVCLEKKVVLFSYGILRSGFVYRGCPRGTVFVLVFGRCCASTTDTVYHERSPGRTRQEAPPGLAPGSCKSDNCVGFACTVQAGSYEYLIQNLICPLWIIEALEVGMQPPRDMLFLIDSLNFECGCGLHFKGPISGSAIVTVQVRRPTAPKVPCCSYQ